MADVEDVYPLSPLQQGLLFHSLYAPGSYVGQLTCRLVGDLDGDAFARAAQLVLDRNPALRTSFVWEGVREPMQVVHRHVEMPVALLDWTDADDEFEQRLATLQASELDEVDLREPPLVRLAVVRRGDSSHQLVWTVHHLLVDGWSGSLIAGEVFATYEALRAGGDPPAVSRRPYSNYIAWLKTRDRDVTKAFWRAALAGFAVPTPLPFAAPGAVARGESWGLEVLRLGDDDTETIASSAREAGVTIGTVVQAAWALVLGRHAGETDVVFGTTTAGRDPRLGGSDEMIGLFINTLPVRVSIDDDRPLRAWLRDLQAELAAMRDHDHAPLHEVQRTSDVPPGRPLFESLFVYQNYPSFEELGGALGSIAIADVVEAQHTNYPLTVLASRRGDLAVGASFDESVLDGASARRLLGQLRGVLLAMAASPDEPIGALAVVARGDVELSAGWQQPDAPDLGTLLALSPEDLVVSLATAGSEAHIAHGRLAAAAGASHTVVQGARLELPTGTWARRVVVADVHTWRRAVAGAPGANKADLAVVFGPEPPDNALARALDSVAVESWAALVDGDAVVAAGPVAEGVVAFRPIGTSPLELSDERGRPVPVGAFGIVSGSLLARWRAKGTLDMLPTASGLPLATAGALASLVATVTPHDGVADAAAFSWADGEIALVVMPTSTGAHAVLPSELWEVLGAAGVTLRPSSVAVVDEIPLLADGAVDYLALAALVDPADSAGDATGVAPRTPEEELMASLWAEALEIDEVGVHDNFFELGGDSVVSVKLIAKVEETFDVELPVKALFDRPTVAGVLAVVEEVCAGAFSERDLYDDLVALHVETEAALDDDVVPPATAAPDGGAVLLTGATSFAGALVLRELLERTDRVVHVLVATASGVDDIADWIGDVLVGRHLDKRLRAVVGSATREDLGLGVRLHSQLAAEVADVVHVAHSALTMFLPYAALRPLNVDSTAELLRFATTTTAKRFHLVSSLRVSSGRAEIGEERLPPPATSSGHFGMAKWVAEELAFHAAERGLPVAIYRAPSLVGDATTGRCDPNDYLSRLVATSMEMGAILRTTMPTALTPADVLARAVVAGIDQRAIGVFHVVDPDNPSPQRMHLGEWLRDAGFAVQDVTHLRWRRLLERHASELGTVVGRRTHSFGVTLPRARTRRIINDLRSFASAVDDSRVYRCDRYAALLGRAGQSFSAVDGALFGRFASSIAQYQGESEC